MTDDPAKDVSIEATAVAPPVGLTGDKPKSNLNVGTFVFVGFSALSLLVCITKGIVPIYGAEAVVWGAMALYWHKKSPVSTQANLILLVLAVVVAAAEGYSYGQHSTGRDYAHLTQGNRQSTGTDYTYLTQGIRPFRVDSRSGRTDGMTTNDGWEPVSFDKPAGEVFKDRWDVYKVPEPILLSNGRWDNSDICFYVQNNSGFVLQDVTVRITISHAPIPQVPPVSPKSGGGSSFFSSLDNTATDPAIPAQHGYDVRLHRYHGGLLDIGKEGFFCARQPIEFPKGAEWSVAMSSATGWKQ
jgi:hypothetical protein